jgi:hypothetical protein
VIGSPQLQINGGTLINANADLSDLVNEPREALDIEVKEWLDLGDNSHRATLAKEIIALANHGGGYLLIGFNELPDGAFMPAQPRPPNLQAWSQDAVQSIVAKYVDPSVQCQVVHLAAFATGEKYPVIVIPGGHRVPVRAKAGSPDNNKLHANRIYIRRPGPSSEEPRTAEEWERFLERCLQNRKAELLDAMRSIMAGIIPSTSPATPNRLGQLVAFGEQSVARWEALIDQLPKDSPPRLIHGHFDVAIAIDGDFDRKSLTELRDIIQSAVRNHSGWPPFLTIRRAPFTPKPVDGAVECWIGLDTDASVGKRPSRHDFWRISPNGLLFTRRGHWEDGQLNGVDPGKSFDIAASIWQLV